MPAIQHDLGLRYAEAGLVLASLSLGGLVGVPIGSLAADYLDRRWLLTGGALAYAGALLLFAFGDGLGVLVAGGLLWGMASDSFIHPATIEMSERFPDRVEPLLARAYVLGSLGDILSPVAIAAAVALGVSWRMLFVIGAATMLAYAVVFLSLGPLPPHRHADEERRPPLSSLLSVLRDGRVLRLALILTLSTTLDEPFVGFLLLDYEQEAGLDAALAALLTGVLVTSPIAGSLAVPRIARLGAWPLPLLAAAAALGIAALVLAPTPPAIVVGALLAGAAGTALSTLLSARALTLRPGQAGAVTTVISYIDTAALAAPLAVGARRRSRRLAGGDAALCPDCGRDSGRGARRAAADVRLQSAGIARQEKAEMLPEPHRYRVPSHLNTSRDVGIIWRINQAARARPRAPPATESRSTPWRTAFGCSAPCLAPRSATLLSRIVRTLPGISAVIDDIQIGPRAPRRLRPRRSALTRAGMSDDLAYRIALLRVPGIGPSKFRRLESAFGDLGLAWAGKRQCAGRCRHRRTHPARRSRRPRRRSTPERELESAAPRPACGALRWNDPAYPRLLREIDAAPPLLFVRGDAPARRTAAPSPWSVRAGRPAYGRQTAAQFARDLAQHGLHRRQRLGARASTPSPTLACLEAGGRTLAVLGSGLDIVYPAENAKLAARVAEQGALVSEYPLGTKPAATNFPQRNRIISGLSRGVLVVEGDRKSGALLTLAYALNQNRETFAVPGSILSPLSDGPNQFIKRGLAKLVTSVEDLVDEVVAIQGRFDLQDVLPDDPVEAALLPHLSAEPIHIDDLCRLADLPAASVSATLVMLELKGTVRHLGGMHYARAV
ncbi:MAG: hypothetical protein KatS3mg060_2169 [Dehalococcoidia bacterium]|nr:MAG: hypothetical protein KatS3mg060_2169 [Dehalococcoidia bacterium]